MRGAASGSVAVLWRRMDEGLADLGHASMFCRAWVALALEQCNSCIHFWILVVAVGWIHTMSTVPVCS